MEQPAPLLPPGTSLPEKHVRTYMRYQFILALITTLAGIAAPFVWYFLGKL